MFVLACAFLSFRNIAAAGHKKESVGRRDGPVFQQYDRLFWIAYRNNSPDTTYIAETFYACCQGRLNR
ncbi:hypothetical protein [Komagataeibacter xylinus]|uniref:hypothetical protein n=1 Tax=Komagataeibacter xylinus TaxID=28448 RepID=UPI0011B67CE9|nr:hypothetical protein [Komagataeibacter xylinus]